MSDLTRQPTYSNDQRALRPVLTTTAPILSTNDIAAIVAAAVMSLGPLAAAAFAVH